MFTKEPGHVQQRGEVHKPTSLPSLQLTEKMKKSCDLFDSNYGICYITSKQLKGSS